MQGASRAMVLATAASVVAAAVGQAQEEDALTREEVTVRLSLVERSSRDEHHAAALEAARTLKADMLAAPGPTDPHLLGWVRFYEFKSLYHLERYQEAYDLHGSTEPKTFLLGAQNLAWMHSVAAECAARTERPADVVRLMLDCIALREEQDDPKGVLMAALSGLQLLEGCDAPQLSAPLIPPVLAVGLEHGAGQVVVRGLNEALAQQGRRVDAALTTYVLERFPALLAVQDRRHEVFEALARVRASAWFREGLGDEGRRRLELGEALWEAAAEGDGARVEEHLAAGAPADHVRLDRAGVPTPLQAAGFQGHEAVVRLLLAHGAPLEQTNVQHRTALVLAADQDQPEVVRLLAEAGADVDHAGFAQQTALHTAGWQGHLEVLRVLLAHGADTELQDVTGHTALSLAATEDVPEVVAALLDAGADLEARVQTKATPLMLAAMEGKVRVVRLLLERGADRAARDENGFTARDWARQEGHAKVLELLEAE